MLFSLITGPGSHNSLLLRALQGTFNFDYTEYWPRYKHYLAGPKGVHQDSGSKFFDAVSWLSYGLQNRFRFISRRKWHQDVLFPLYDRINRNRISGTHLIAWPQASYFTMKRVKETGGRVILEQPMCHVDFRNRISREEHSRLGMRDDLSYSEFMTHRIKKEYLLADKLVVLSSFARKTFADNGIEEGKISINLPGMDVPAVKRERSSSKLKVLYAGRIEVPKGVVDLIRAVAPLTKHVELHLAGQVQDRLKTFLREYEDKFTFYGPVNRATLDALYQAADVVVFPSLYDAFGMVILEAMSYGVPVVASAHSAGPDLINDGEHGFIVPPSNPEILTERIEWMASHRNETARMGLDARAHIERDHSFSTYAHRVVELLNATFA